MIIQRFERNTRGRDLVVGDIHGYFSRLQDVLDEIGFDPARDRLFSVGDLVDRGPESDTVLEWLAKPWFHPVMGNHELLAIMFAQGDVDASAYVGCGGGWNMSNPPEQRRVIADAFSSLPIAIEVQTSCGLVGIVHAECPHDDWLAFTGALGADDISQTVNCALWSRDRISALSNDSIENVRAVVVGHTPVDRMTSLGNTLFIDTGAWKKSGRRQFTILDLESLAPLKLKMPALDWTE